MDLYVALLLGILANEEVQVTFPSLKISVYKIIKERSYQALQQIKIVIEDDSLGDGEALLKIKTILYTLESAGWRSKDSPGNPPNRPEKR